MVLLGSIRIKKKTSKVGPHGFRIFTDAPFEFVKKQLSRFPAKLFLCRDSTLNSEAKTKPFSMFMAYAKDINLQNLSINLSQQLERKFQNS